MKQNSEFNKNLRLIAKSSLFVFLALMLSKVFNYAYRIVVARQLGPEVYGFYSLALMVSGWFTVLALAGMGEGVIRYVSFYRGKNSKSEMSETFLFALKFVAVFSILLGLLMFFSSEFLANQIFNEPSLKIFFQLFSLTVPAFSISQIFLGNLKAFEKVAQSAFLINILNPLVKLITLLLLLSLGLSFLSIPYSVIGGYLVLLVSCLFISRKFIFNRFGKKGKTRIKKELLTYSLPLMFASFIASILGWTDTFFIGYFKTATDVGVYNSALPIALMMTIPSFLFIQLFFPIINREISRGNIDLISELSKQVGKWIFILNVPLFFFMVFFPQSIINVLFGKEYLSSSYALILLAIGFLFFAQSEVSANLLGMIKKSKTRMINILMALIVGIILNILLIPQEQIFYLDNSGGLVGAALATMLAYLFYSILSFSQGYIFLKIIPARRKMLGVLFSGFVSGLLTWLLRGMVPITKVSIIALLILFGITYLLMLLITRSLDKNDIFIINLFKNKLSRNNSNY